MNLIIRCGAILLFAMLSLQASGQETGIGKELFPDNEHAQWLVHLLGLADVSKMVLYKNQQKPKQK